jgi:hypothetical protein
VATVFEHTLRALQADRWRGGTAAIALALMISWIVWVSIARVPVYRTSEHARLEVRPGPAACSSRARSCKTQSSSCSTRVLRSRPVPSFVRRHPSELGVLIAGAAALVFMVQCSVQSADRSGWTKTTGELMGVGTVSSSRGTVGVSYKDPETGESTTGDMEVRADSAQMAVDAAGMKRQEEPVYIFKSLTGRTVICVESYWEPCHERAAPAAWMYLLVAGIMAAVIGSLVARGRKRRAGDA